mgnify:FL=1
MASIGFSPSVNIFSPISGIFIHAPEKQKHREAVYTHGTYHQGRRTVQNFPAAYHGIKHHRHYACGTYHCPAEITKKISISAAIGSGYPRQKRQHEIGRAHV